MHQPDIKFEIWIGCNSGAPAVAKFIQNTVIQPKIGLLCISQESPGRFYEKEKQKKSEVIPPRLFAFLSKIHVVIILQRQVLASAITTQWEDYDNNPVMKNEKTRVNRKHLRCFTRLCGRFIYDAFC